MNRTLKAILLAAAIAFLLSANWGCAQMFTAKTTANYVTPDGRIINYESDKDHEGLDAKWTSTDAKGVKTEVHIKTVKSGTPEVAMAAVMQLYVKLTDALDKLAPLLTKAAAMGGS